MTLRNQQALWFLAKLKEQYPNLIREYERLYQFKYDRKQYKGSYTPKGSYLLEKHQLLLKLSESYSLPYRIKRFIPNDFRHFNYRIAEAIFSASFKQQMLGNAWEKMYWAAHHIQNLKQDIKVLAQMNALNSIKGMDQELIEKIHSYLKKY